MTMSIFDPARRAYVHFVSIAVVAVLATITVAGSSWLPLIPAAVVAAFDLAVAVKNSSGVAQAVYGLALVAQPIGLAVQFGTDQQWGAALALLAAILGGGLAAGRAPMPGTTVVAGTEYGYGHIGDLGSSSGYVGEYREDAAE